MADVEASGFVAVSSPTEEGAVPDIPDTVCQDDIGANGHLVPAASDGQVAEGVSDENKLHNGTIDTGAIAEASIPVISEKTSPSKPERLYFVRLPKPDLGNEDITIEKVRAEFNSFKEGCDLLLATLKVHRVKQDEAKREFETADQVFQDSRAAKDRWQEQLEPLRNANKLVSEQRTQMKDNFRELEARTEEELDKMIDDIEYSLSHETLSVQEERKLIAQLKKLEKTRPRVRTAQAAFVQLEQSKEHLEDFRQHKQELEKKFDMIKAEVNDAKEVKAARYAVLKSIRERTNQFADELKALRASKDAKWEELNRLRDARKRKLDQYYENRRFSQTVRQMLAKGPEGVAEAKQQCADLNDKLIALISDDSEFRSEYNGLWDLQRKYSVTLADLALDSTPAKKVSLTKSAPDGKAAPSGKSRAQDIISALMAEADAELGLAPSVPSTSTAKSLLPTSNGHALPATAIPGVTKPKPAPKPKDVKVKAATAMPDIENVYEPYVPPPKSSPEDAAAAKLSAEQRKLALREEQRQKAAEAEERKKKREEAKLKKISKASELAKLKEEEEELKAELERERIRREADEQRRREARRKEEAKRRGAITKSAKNSKHSAQSKEPAQAKKPKVKLSLAGRAKKFGKDNEAILYIGGVVVALAVVLYMAVQWSK